MVRLLKKHKADLKEIVQEFIGPDSLTTHQMFQLVHNYLKDQLEQFQKQFEKLYQTNRFDLSSKLRLEILIQELYEFTRQNKHETLQIFRVYMDEVKEKVVEPIESKTVKQIKPIINQSQFRKDFIDDSENNQQVFHDIEPDANRSNLQPNSNEQSESESSSNDAKKTKQSKRAKKNKKKQQKKKQYVPKAQKNAAGICDLLKADNEQLKKTKVLFIIILPHKQKATLKVANQDVKCKDKIEEINCYIYAIERSQLKSARLQIFQDGYFGKCNESVGYVKDLIGPLHDRSIYIHRFYYSSIDIQKSELIRIFAKLCELTKRSQSTNQGIFVETIKELANIYKYFGYTNDFHLVNLQPLMKQYDFYTTKYSMIFWNQVFSQKSDQIIFVKNLISYNTHRNITSNFRDEANMYKNNKVFREFYAFLCRIQLYAHLCYEHYNWQQAEAMFFEIINTPQTSQFQFLRVICFTRPEFFNQINDTILNKIEDEQNQNNINAVQYFILQMYNLNNKFFYQNQRNFQAKSCFISLKIMEIAKFIEKMEFKNYKQIVECRQRYRELFTRDIQAINRVFFSNGNIRFQDFVVSKAQYLEIYKAYKKHLSKYEQINDYFQKYLNRFFLKKFSNEKINLLDLLSAVSLGVQNKEEMLLVEQIICKIKIDQVMLSKIVLLFNEDDCDSFRIIDILKMYYGMKQHLQQFAQMNILQLLAKIQSKSNQTSYLKKIRAFLSIIHLEYNHKIKQKKSAIYHLKLSLKQKDKHIQQIYGEIVLQKIIQQLKDKKKSELQIYSELSQKIPQLVQLEANQQDLYFKTVYSFRILKIGLKPNQILKMMLDSPFKLAYEREYYEDNLKKCLLEIQKTLIDRYILQEQLVKLRENRKIISETIGKYFNFDTILQSIQEQLKLFQQKSKILKNIMFPYKQFAKHLDELNFKEKLESLKLNQALTPDPELAQLYDIAIQINFISKTKYWQCKPEMNKLEDLIDNQSIIQEGRITSIKDFSRIYQRSINELRRQINNYIEQDMKLQQFTEKFVQQDGIIKVLQVCLEEKEKKVLDTMVETINKINQKYVKRLLYFMKTVNQFLQLYGYNKRLKYQRIVQKVESIGKQTQKFTKQILHDIKQLQTELENIFLQQRHYNKIDRFIKKDPIFKLIELTIKNHELFQFYVNQKINKQAIQELIEYIDDIEGTSIGFDAIKQFQRVVQYFLILQKNKNINELIRQLRLNNQQIKHISICLDSCYSLRYQLQQIVWKAKNRQLSFKCQIEQIFKGSVFSCSCYPQIRIEIFLDSKRLENKSQKVSITYKEMSLFKQKSLLIIRDMKKIQKQNNKNVHQTIILLQKFEEFFSIVENIYKSLVKLDNYGYNVQSLTYKQRIQKGQYVCISKLSIELQEQSKRWISFIKQIYSSSYLLTHYIGPQLNNFIKQCQKEQYLPAFRRILKVDHKKFNTTCKLQYTYRQNIQKFKETNDFYKKVKHLAEAFENVDMNENIRQESHKITIIKCNPCDTYAVMLSPRQLNKEKLYEFAESTQVLFCQEATSKQEIQIFMYRALIYWSKKHYVIACHNLSQDVKIFFTDLLIDLNKNRKSDFQRAQLCFVVNTYDKITGLLTRPRQFNHERKEVFQKQSKELTKQLSKHLAKTIVVESVRAGLGKTFRVQRQAKKKLIYFPICGNIKFQNLSARLKKILESYQEFSLLIQIGHVENKRKLQVFLAQMVLFRSFYYQEYVFLPSQTQIFIQIENVFQPSQKKQNKKVYHIIQMLKNQKQVINIQKFDIKELVFDEKNLQDKFTLIYIDLVRTDMILTQHLSYKYMYEENEKDIKTPSDEKSRNNIKFFFVDWFVQKKQEPTFLIYKCFMKMLFNAFKAFSDSPHLHMQQFQDLPQQYKVMRLQEVRREFLNICIENILQFLEQSVTTNDFSDNKNREQLRRFQDKLQNVPLLIVPNADYQGYQFVYLDDKNVNIAIKSLLIKSSAQLNNKLRRIKDENTIHELFHLTALNSLQDQLIFKLCDIMYHISNNKNFQTNFVRGKNLTLLQLYEKIPRLKFYKITIDNFYKMCLIILRAFSGVPSIIMGESGVGKTALIDFLVNQIFQDKLLVYNVHAGIHQKEISQWVDQIKTSFQQLKQQLNSKQKLHTKQKRLWVFFDEFNTSDELSYFKEIIIDRKFMGVKLPENIIFLAACNPYRHQKQRKINSGLALPSKINQAKQLAFKVKPPCLSMIQIMWDYQQLKKQEIKQYVESMIEQVQFFNKKRLIDIIVQAHEYFKDNVQISSVSLRDVSRFRELYNWFLIYIPAEEQHKRRSHLQLQKRENTINNYELARDDRAVILSFCFCYSLRIQNRDHRKDFLNMMQKTARIQRDFMITVLQNQQIDYINRLKYSEQKIAYNNALMQNLFSTLICLINKIPILIIGNPGSSKSISIKMLDSNLKGIESQSQFCKDLPAINLLNFQGSESSTSEGIQKIYQKAQLKIRQQKQNKYNKKSEVIQCILFDEIGLAQKSVHNPLKVLHSKLQTHKKDLGFIGISNYELDAAKMSRFLVLAHSNPDKIEIRDTAVKIYRSYFPDQLKYQQKFKKLGEHYFNFIQTWNSNQENRHNFFGLRDFYSYIKYICLEMKKEDFQLSGIQKIILKSIQINFDGQPNSVQLFCRIAQIKQEIQIINPIQMVVDNLSNVESRCLMLIIKNQALIPMINQSIVVKGQKRDVVCIYGSTFQADKESEEYNLQITSKIISYVSRGTILVFKDINNSIQTSLYDLFNKSFSYRNRIKTCRIAVGANSNPKCTVHQNFNAIVYVQEEMVKNLDLPFINRLQKHELNIMKMIDTEDFKILQQIEEWIARIIGKKQDIKLKNNNFIVNSSKQALVTLIFKHKQADDIALQVKKDLLKNRTTDFKINLRQKSEDIKLQIQNLIQEIISFSRNQTDMIIYTYDQFSNTYEENEHNTNQNYIIRLGELKAQKDLRAELASALNEQKYRRIQIFVNYQHQYMHLNYLLFVARQIKAQFQVQKQIVIIIQLHRFTFIKERNQILNISYLHRYQQYFVEDISKNTNLSEILELQTFEELYNKMNFQQKLSILHLQALKLIKIKSEQPESQQFVMDSFQVAAEMFSHNQYYRQQIEALIAKNLKYVKIDLNQIQSVNEIVLYSSNTYQALQKYMTNFVQEIMVRFLMFIITQGLLIMPKEVYVLLNKKDHLPIIKEYLPLLSEIYVDLLIQNANNLQKKNSNQRFNKINRLVQDNQVKLPIFLSIFPQSFKDFSIIFRLGSQISVQSMLQEIKFKVYSEQEKGEIQNRFEGMKAKLMNIKLRKIKISQENQRQYKICQNAYFYDCFMFYLGLLKLNLHPIQEIELFQFFNTLLEKLQFMIEEKIIFLVSNRIFFQNLCSLLVPLFKQINSAKFIDKAILDITQDELIINILIKIAQKSLLQACQLIKLKRDSLEIFQQDITAFIKFIRVIYRKMKLLGKNFSQIDQFKIDPEYDTTYKFIEFLNTLKKHKEGNEEQKLLKYFLQTSDAEDKSLNFKIFKFIESFLKKQNDQMVNQEIIDYLSLFVWPEWYQKIEKHPQERKEGIRSYIDLSIKYTLFANNSTIFFNCLLQQLQNQSFKQIYQIMKSYDKDKDYLHLQPSDLNFKNNFSIAFGNYLQTLFLRLQIQDSQLLDQQEQFFIELCSKKQLKNNCQGLFILQFLKFYGKSYLIELQKGQKIDLLLNMDEALFTQNLQVRHLRMFLLKEIYQKYKDFSKIKDQYIGKNKCQWINLLKDYIQQKKIELFLPPLIDDSDEKYLTMLLQLQQTKFNNIQLYHEVIRVAFYNKNPWNTYQLLNFFMLKFYRREIPQQTINLLKSQLERREDVHSQQFILIYRLLQGYLMHNVAQLFIYNEDHFKQQIVFLNYFNLIVAGRTLNIPLNNMFFNEKGVVPKQYSKWLNQRYLIGTIHNPAAKRLEFILERHKLNLQGNSYTICSNVCDYISPVGGTFYGKNDGCAHPLNNATCPFCGGVLGAHAYNVLTNADKGARVILPKDIEQQLPRINQKREIEVLYHQNKTNLSFVGIQNYKSIKNLQQYAQMIKQFNGISCDRMRQTGDMISYKLLQMLINITWYFLAELQIIETEEIQSIWQKTKRQTKEVLYQAIMFYYGDLRKCLKIESKDDFIVWNLGISSQLSHFYLQCHSKKIDCDLRNVQTRDFFELEFQNIFSVFYQKEKQALINQSRNFEQKDKTDIIKEIGSYEQHEVQFQYISMFKIVKNNPCYEDMKINYKNTIIKSYPVLAYMIENEDITQKLYNYKKIFIYLSALQELFDGKMKRNQSQKGLKGILHFTENSNKLCEKLPQFVNCWNNLAKDKFELKIDCHSEKVLGNLPQITEDSPLRMFLMDKKTTNNQHAQRLLAFVQIASRQYNERAQTLERLIVTSYPYYNDLQVFSKIPLNPTHILNCQSQLVEFPINRIIQLVDIYSSQSVKYGESKPHYSLQNIQRVLIKEFIGCKYIITQKERFRYITYVGQRSHFISQLRDRQDQKTLQQVGLKEKIQKYFNALQVNHRASFEKEIKHIQGSLQQIIAFYMNIREKKFISAQTICEFIAKYQMKGIATCFKENPLDNVQNSCLANLYQFVQNYSFEGVQQLVSPIYKAALDQRQRQNTKRLIMKLKNSDGKSFPIYNDFKIALYRFTGRILTLSLFNQNNKLSDYLCEESYWPKNSQNDQALRELSKHLDNMTLSKVGSLLKEVPFKDKTEVKVQAKQQVENITAPQVQQKKNKTFAKKKIAQNYS